MDEISSKGFAYGYVGGGLLLAIHLIVIMLFTDTEYADLVTRLCIASVGVWWFGWALWTFRTVPEPILKTISNIRLTQNITMAVRELKETTLEILKFRVIVLYLIAYFLFNDGIQTVLSVAGAFAADTLGVSLIFNMITILVIQFIAAPGAIIFGKIAKYKTAKKALVSTLILWCIIITFGVGIAPLSPENPQDYDYLISYQPANQVYSVVKAPTLSNSDTDKHWIALQEQLIQDDSISTENLRVLIHNIS